MATQPVLDLLESFAAELERLQEIALRFPKSPEEYKSQPLPDRLTTAADIMKQYANVSLPSDQRWAHTNKATTKIPDVVIQGRVGFDHRDYGIPEIPDVFQSPVLEVELAATHTNAEIQGGFQKLASIKLSGPDGPQVIIQGESMSIGDERCQPIFDIVDAAAGNLLAGIIATHQNLGNVAISQALASDAPEPHPFSR